MLVEAFVPKQFAAELLDSGEGTKRASFHAAEKDLFLTVFATLNPCSVCRGIFPILAKRELIEIKSLKIDELTSI